MVWGLKFLSFCPHVSEWMILMKHCEVLLHLPLSSPAGWTFERRGNWEKAYKKALSHARMRASPQAGPGAVMRTFLVPCRFLGSIMWSENPSGCGQKNLSSL
ncbi:uncharacterized protein LOC125632051 [Caretta caretta]|uniref:uncharacterized protein LOC125632051 n=1 Tax=Caretta caretta TaxID=8467 RepID=UPI003F4AF90A